MALASSARAVLVTPPRGSDRLLAHATRRRFAVARSPRADAFARARASRAAVRAASAFSLPRDARAPTRRVCLDRDAFDRSSVTCRAATEGSEKGGGDEAVECVIVGTEAACVVSEDEDDEFDAGDAATSVARAGEDAAAADGDGAGGLLAALGGAALISPFFLWGTSMVAMKEVLPVTSPLFVASIRLVPAGLVLIAWAASTGRPWPKGGMAWLAISLFAAVDGTAFQGCLSEGLQRTSAGLGSVIIDSQPLTVAILASIIYGETLAPAGVAGLGLGVVGLLMLELPREALAQLASGDAQSAIAAVSNAAERGLWDSGEWWLLLAAQSMAVGTVMVRWVCKYVDPVMATGWHMAIGGVPLLAYSIATEPAVYAGLPNLDAGDVGGLVYASLFGSAVAYGAFFYFASKGSLTKLSSLTFLTPMFAALFGYLLLDETLDEVQLAGALVTVVGIYLVNTRASEAEEAPAGEE